MPEIIFLEASVPLTKRFTPAGKEAYPLVSTFTSHSHNITTIIEFCQAITAHAKLGHCLLKGQLTHPLVKESRRNTTRTDEATQWVCLDFDRHECGGIDEELTAMGLGDISYVLQYSASHGLDENEGTQSAHVFMLLSDPVPAPTLKSWLMDLNFKHLRDGLRLSRSKSVLSWPLDITTCQNDKLLYIAPPTFVKPLKDPLALRISLVPKKTGSIPVTRIGGAHINALKTEERKILNELRKAEGLPTRNAKTSWIGTVEVVNKPDTCTVTGIKEGDEFIRLNLNGGDSWAYWHHKDSFELVHDFKSDTWYKTKELVPGYYQQLVEERQALNATPTENGDLILAFRDLSTAEYYNGLWNPGQNRLELHRARNETQLDHWMRSHGRVMGDFIPVWDMYYDPLSNVVIDEENHRINTFQCSRYFNLTPDANAKSPVIQKIIAHMLGATVGDELYEHFINWLAVIFQRKSKALTAWVVNGVEGTGKGTLFDKIITPLFGLDNVFAARVDNVEENFNGWMEGKLFIMIDEVDVDDFREKGRVTSKLRNYITEPKISMRHMRQTAVYKPNYASFLFASNRKQPVYIPESDRRYNVGNYQRCKLVYPGDEAIMKELEAFAQFLLAHRADIEAANNIIHTESRARIQKLGVTSVDETCQIVLSGDFDALWRSMPDERLMAETGIVNDHTRNAQAYCMLLRRMFNELHEGKITRDELFVILQYNVGNMPVTPNKFTALLRHHGIETKWIRKNNIKTYGLEVKWKISDELREELSETLKPSKPLLRKVV